MYIGREKEYSKKTINGLVQATDQIINFQLDHPVYIKMLYFHKKVGFIQESLIGKKSGPNKSL